MLLRKNDLALELKVIAMPGKRFCPKCGKTYEGEGLCSNCYMKQHRLFEAPAFVEVKICPRCAAVFRKGKWKKTPVDETITAAIKDELRINSQAKNPEIEIHLELIDSYSMRATLKVSATVKGERVSKKETVTVRLRRDSCERCSRIAGGYYSAIVQIRGDLRVPDKRELIRASKIAHDAVQRMRLGGDEMAFITDEKEVDEGIDLYASTAGAGKQISNAIVEDIGGYVSSSPKLIGKKEGKEIYRVTYSVRLPEFVSGDIAAIDDDVIEVRRVGKLLSGINLKTGARYSRRREELKNVLKIGSKVDKKKAILTMTGESEIQILDPDDFSPVYLSRPAFLKAESGSEIFVVKTEKGIFVLPD